MSGRTDSPAMQAMTSSALAVVLAAEGRAEEARAARLEAIQLYERKGNLVMASRLRREGAVDTAQPSSA